MSQTKPTIRTMDDDLRRFIEDALPHAQYNPYKRWIIGPGNPATRTELLVLTIKLNDQEAIAACPERHLVATGSDYIETGIALGQALKETLNRAPDTAIAATCNMAFDLDGQVIKPAAAPRIAMDDIPEAPAPEPEPAEAQATNSTEQANEQGSGLFDQVDGQLEGDTDPNDEIQPSLF